MATTPAIPATRTQLVRRTRQWTTPEILKGSRIVILLLEALLLISIFTGTQVHRSSMQTVGKDAAPSIIAAQHIKSALADMDSDAANELLEPAGSAAQKAEFQAYEARREEAAKALIGAAENITYGDSERVPIQTLQVGLGTYERQVQRALDLQMAGNMPAAVQAYREAESLMDRTLLYAANMLDNANNDVLERTYTSQADRAFGARTLICMLGLVTLLALVAMQLFLAQRTRRMLNPLLLGAMLLTLGVTAYADHELSTEQHDLRAAREDAFTSLHVLWRARAVAYSANSDESRYLLEPAHNTDHQSDFNWEVEDLASLPEGLDQTQALATLAAGGQIAGFRGYLADELNNITFTGEREAAVRTLAAFEQYLAVDTEMRRLERSGQHAQAISLDLGKERGQVGWVFTQFDNALGLTLEINQEAFDRSVADGFSAVRGLELTASLLCLTAGVLIFLGFSGRIREYD